MHAKVRARKKSIDKMIDEPQVRDILTENRRNVNSAAPRILGAALLFYGNRVMQGQAYIDSENLLRTIQVMRNNKCIQDYSFCGLNRQVFPVGLDCYVSVDIGSAHLYAGLFKDFQCLLMRMIGLMARTNGDHCIIGRKKSNQAA